MRAPVQWSSDNEKVATVDQEGFVTAVATGMATVTVRSGEIYATVPVDVTLVDKLTAVEKLELPFDEEGLGYDAQVVAATADGRVLKVKPNFRTQNEKVCRVDGNGQIHATEPGDTIITASVDGQTVNIPCRVVEEKGAKKKR